MKEPLILICLIFCFSCAYREKQLKLNLEQSKTEMLNDTFKVSGQVILREYLGEYGNIVTEEEKTYFEKVNDKDLLIEINEKRLISRDIDKSSIKLSVKGFKSTTKKYDKLIWEIKNEGQTAMDVWYTTWMGDYFKTVQRGCCSEEDGYRLYDLETGKHFLSHTGDLMFSDYPTWNFTGYHAGSSATFDFDPSNEIIGNLYYSKIDTNYKATLTNYDIYCKNFLEEFLHTPHFEIKLKSQLKDEGFFQKFNLFKDGQEITQLDTADCYLVLEYDTKLRILIPVIDKGLMLDAQLATDKDLSRDLRIKSR